MCSAVDQTRRADAFRLCSVASEARSIQGETEADAKRPVEKRLGGICEWVFLHPIVAKRFRFIEPKQRERRNLLTRR